MRIVSLVPSLTHLLVDLGLEEQIVGCTKFCVQPPSLHRTAQLCGGTKDPDLELIKRLQPTHILVNEEENKPAHIRDLAKFAPTLNTFPKSPEEVPNLVREICRFLGVTDQQNIATQCEALINDVRAAARNLKPRSYIYFIWKNPWMAVSEDTYISRFLELFGWKNLVNTADRYPQLEIPAREMEADVLFFSSEPWPFRKRDLKDLADIWPGHPPVVKADGMLCSWYGSMLIPALNEAKKYCRGEPQQLFSVLEL